MDLKNLSKWKHGWPRLNVKRSTSTFTDFPFGLPVVEIDGNGIFYGQSNAINRYIAKKYGKIYTY